MPHYLLWLLAGVVFLAAEALGASGVGLLFAGLGALTIGTLVTVQPELSVLSQWIIFLATTGLWAIFLWKPLQKFRGRSSNDGYKNIVGDTAFVGAHGLQKNVTGEVTWSGTIMRAELAEGVENQPAGAQVLITDVAGNTLIVKPKQ